MDTTTDTADAFQPWQQMFRAGTHLSLSGEPITITDAEVLASARAYDPAKFRAPLVVGHPETDSPAYGWIDRCLAAPAPEGAVLEGLTAQVDPAFAAGVVAGRYPNRSVALFPPTHPRNPVPGVWYPRHLGYLGGHEPGVRGLRPSTEPPAAAAALAADTEGLAVVMFAAQPEEPQMADVAAQKTTETPPPPPGPSSAEFAASQAKIAELETKLAGQADAAKRIRDLELELRRRELIGFAAGVVKDGALVPRLEGQIVAVLLEPVAQTVRFAAGEGAEQAREVSRDDALRALIRDLADPKNRVPMGEFAGKDKGVVVTDAEDAEIESIALRMAGLPPKAAAK